ncbi:hypothetical protein SNEBB_001507, partial [Seison nebaliae]
TDENEYTIFKPTKPKRNPLDFTNRIDRPLNACIASSIETLFRTSQTSMQRALSEFMKNLTFFNLSVSSLSTESFFEKVKYFKTNNTKPMCHTHRNFFDRPRFRKL